MYRGDVSKPNMLNSRNCLPWALIGNHSSDAFPGWSLHGSHCRNPDHRAAPYCYTRYEKGLIEWEYCDIERCSTGTNDVSVIPMSTLQTGKWKDDEKEGWSINSEPEEFEQLIKEHRRSRISKEKWTPWKLSSSKCKCNGFKDYERTCKAKSCSGLARRASKERCEQSYCHSLQAESCILQAGGGGKFWLYYLAENLLTPSKRPIGRLQSHRDEPIFLGQAACVWRGQLVISGGSSPQVPAFTNQISIFTPNKETKRLGEMNSPRRDHTMNSIKLNGNEILLIYGGYRAFIKSRGDSRWVYVEDHCIMFDGNTTTPVRVNFQHGKASSIKRAWHLTVNHGSQLIIMSGDCGDATTTCKEMLKF